MCMSAIDQTIYFNPAPSKQLLLQMSFNSVFLIHSSSLNYISFLVVGDNKIIFVSQFLRKAMIRQCFQCGHE